MKRKVFLVSCAALGFVVSSPAAGTYYAKSVVQSVPSMENGAGGVWVTKSATSTPSSGSYLSQDSSSTSKSALTSSTTISFYAYRPDDTTTYEFLGWSKDANSYLTNPLTEQKSLFGVRYLTHEITTSSKSSSSPATETIYAHYHVHDQQYVTNADGVTIEYRCVNTASTCGNSCGSSSATLNVAGKTYDGTAVTASVTGDQSATIEYYQGSTKVAAPTAAGDYTAKMTFGDKSVTKDFTIAPATLDAIALDKTELFYTGAEQTVTVTGVTASEGAVTLGTDDYTITGNKGAGDPSTDTQYTVTVTPANSNFTGTPTANWVIRGHTHGFSCVVSKGQFSASCTNDNCTLSGSAALEIVCEASGKEYDGSALTATIKDNTTSPQTFESFTGGTRDAEVTWDDASANVGEHTATFHVTVEGKEYVVSNTFTIVQKDITSSAAITLSATDLKYKGTEQTVSITSVKAGDFDITYTEDADSVRAATLIGTYMVKLTANGNFTGSASTTWQISNYTGSFASDALATSATGCEMENETTVAVTNSSKLLYVEPNSWRLSSVLTWPRTFPSISYSQDDNSVVYVDEDHAIIEALDDTTTLDIKVREYKVPLASTVLATHSYIDTLTWTVDVTLDDITNAVAKGEKSLDYVLYVGAESWTHYTTGIAMTTYVMTLPLDDILLFDNDGHQIYPVPEHIHYCDYTLDGPKLTGVCVMPDGTCDLQDRTTGIELVISGYSEGVSPTSTISNETAFLAAVNMVSDMVRIDTVGYVRLTDDGAEVTKWYVGDYKADCLVRVSGLGNLILTNYFSITKSAEYTSGWTVGSRDIRYDTWEEALEAAKDGDTIYYRDGDRDYATHEYSVGDKNITIDFGGAKLTRTGEIGDMTISNTGSAALTLQNVEIEQPKGTLISFQISANGSIVFGTGVKTTNKATNPDRYLKITVTDGSLVVTNGLYQNSFASSGTGTYKLRGGKYNSTYGEPTADTEAGYIVRVIEGDYDREIVYHEHFCEYTAETNVISAICTTNDNAYCGFGTQTARLVASNSVENGAAYSQAFVEYSEKFPITTATITYWSDEGEIAAPTLPGEYTAKVTIGGATAEHKFTIRHVHNFEYDADQNAGTITARCTVNDNCEFNVNKRVATLTASNGVYSAGAQDYAKVTKTYDDYPTNVVLSYTGDATPTNAGTFTATMTAGEKSVTREFTIAPMSVADAAITLSATALPYTGENQSITIDSAKVGGLDITYDVASTSVLEAAAIGVYGIGMKATGNFTGDMLTYWEITNYAGTVESVLPAIDGQGEVVGETMTVTNSTKLEYDAANKVWYAGLKITWGMKQTAYTALNFGYVEYTKPEKTRITAGETTFTGYDTGAYSGGTVSNKQTTATYWKNFLNDKDYTYLETTVWRVKITPEMMEAAKSEGALTATMYAGAFPFSENDDTQFSQGTAFKTYTIKVPVNADMKLFDEEGHQIYPIPDHIHRCEYSAKGAKLTVVCTNEAGECEFAARTSAIELTVTGGADGVAPELAISNKVEFLKAINLTETVVTIGDIKTERLTDDSAAYDKWYVGEYRATCPVTIVGLGEVMLTNNFSITKSAEYTSGWTVGSRDIRYDTWEESLTSAKDGDTIYYRDGDRDYATHEYSVGNKNITIDFGGAKLTRTGEIGDMTISNTGSAALTLQNVEIEQPKGTLISFQISANGSIVFGTGVKTTNKATNPDRYLKITVTDGSLVVTNGLYQNSFASSGTGTYKLRGGKYNSTYGEPTADTEAGYIVRVIEGDYDREIVYHEHFCEYTAETNVISAVCTTNDNAYCGFGTQTARLVASNSVENGAAYSQAFVEYSEKFPITTATITYWSGEGEIAAPVGYGVYTAKVTIAGVTAVKEFEIVHAHHFEYDVDQEAGTITARCTRQEECDYNVNKRVATLTASSSVYTGVAQELAKVTKNYDDFPTNVVLSYSGDATPKDAGDYTATMTAGNKSVTTNFSIAKASMANATITMSATSLYYTGAEQSVSVSSIKLGDYTLVEGVDYTNSTASVLAMAGSGASNVTANVEFLGRGNFADDSQTITWTIIAPTRDFEGVDKYGETGGTLVGSTLTMEGSNWVYFAATDAPDGSGVAGWYAGLQLTWPVDEKYFFQFTRDEAALHTLSTQPGQQFWGNDLSSAVGLTAYTANALLSQIKYIKYTYWWTRLSPADAESFGGDVFTRSMTACGIRWSKSGSAYKDDDGVKEITCAVNQPIDGLVLIVPEGVVHDIGATLLDRVSLKLGRDAKVSTTKEQTSGKIFTDETDYAIRVDESDGVWTYSCVPPVTLEVTDVDKTEYKVYSEDDEREGTSPYLVPYNSNTYVVYTVTELGYYFADGSTVATNRVDTTTDPAMVVGELPAAPMRPRIKLGVIAQRYPYDGIIDVTYGAFNWHNDGCIAAIEMKIGDKAVTNLVDSSRWQGRVNGITSFDLKAVAPNTTGKAKFKALIIAQP